MEIRKDEQPERTHVENFMWIMTALSNLLQGQEGWSFMKMFKSRIPQVYLVRTAILLTSPNGIDTAKTFHCVTVEHFACK